MLPDMTTTAEPLTRFPANGFPASEWVRNIEFVDAQSDDGEHVPVHVTQYVRLNGQRASRFTSFPDDRERPTQRGLRIRNDKPVSVRSNGGLTQSETIVSFTIHAEDCKIPTPADPEARIGGLKCLTPPLDQHPWRVETDPDGQAWVTVTLQVRSASFVPGAED